MSDDPIRIVIIDRQPLFREAITVALAADSSLVVSEAVGTATEGAAVVGSAEVDVALLDRDLPDLGDPASYIAILRRYSPRLRFMLVGDDTGVDAVAVSVEFGADGYLTRQATSAELLARVREVLAGTSSQEHPEALRKRLKERQVYRQTEAKMLAGLSFEDRRLTKLLARSASIDEIASELHLERRDARAAVRKLLVTLGVTSVMQLREILQQHVDA